MPGKFWADFEAFVGHKFPKILKDILNINGLDNELAFEFIDSNAIDNLEKVVNENKEILKKSSYEKTIELPSKFSFGHRLLLLNLSKKYKEFSEDKKNKIFARKQRLIELNESEYHSNNTPEHLIRLLIDKLNKYSDKFNLGYKITADQVKKFNQKECDALCVVKCPYCEIKIPCSFASHWRISNFNNHVKTHLPFETIEVPVENTVASLAASTVPNSTKILARTETAVASLVPASTENTVVLSVQRARHNVLQEVDKYTHHSFFISFQTLIFS